MALRQDSLELWGGIECTVNRVGERYFDQLVLSGHQHRISDLDRIHALGLRTLRYPVLWERCHTPTGCDFTWPDQRLAYLRELGIEPIVGLLHHGSGPPHTSLLDPDLPNLFARYAQLVAERYPWVKAFTPVNEPLTTARFSGLYGHWYPHQNTDEAFVKALVVQCRATALAMKAIRAVIPDAKLLQTEDLAYCRSTAELGYQADFENERRWLSLDLLCGRVNQWHPLFPYLLRHGMTMPEIEFFQEAACPPDTLGFNYYVTSERFIDSRVGLYPPHTIGGNARHRYADVEAVRVCPEGLVGPGVLLSQAQVRFGLPMAITEVHLGCTPLQQVSWLAYVWNSVARARRNGVNVRAVTVWSLLGSYFWDNLVTSPRGTYEPGAFRVRGEALEETPLGELVRSLAKGVGAPTAHGWWLEPQRLLYGADPHPPSHRMVIPELLAE